MAREKTEKTVITFPTTIQAMKMERAARENGWPGRLIPVPRQISAGCGMAWSAPAGERELFARRMEENGIEAEKICELIF